MNALLANNESQALRIYYAYDEKTQQKNLILTSVNKDGMDIEKSGVIIGVNACPSECQNELKEQTFSQIIF